MANLPKLPDYAESCYVDEDGVTQQLPAGQDIEYRNLFLMALADVPSTESQDDIDSLFLCPITGAAIKSPVITPSGVTYERAAIEEWLKHHTTDPMDRSPLTVSQLRPNQIVTQLTREYQALREGEPLPVGMEGRTLEDVYRRFSEKMAESIEKHVAIISAPLRGMTLGTIASLDPDAGSLAGTSVFASGVASSGFVPATLGSALVESAGESVSASGDATTVMSQPSSSQGEACAEADRDHSVKS